MDTADNIWGLKTTPNGSKLRFLRPLRFFGINPKYFRLGTTEAYRPVSMKKISSSYL